MYISLCAYYYRECFVLRCKGVWGGVVGGVMGGATGEGRVWEHKIHGVS